MTERFCEAHPAARVEIVSMTSAAIQRSLDAFEIEAGLTYLENEPLVRVRRVPLYRERYIFISSDARHAGARSITWAEAATEPLCLLTESMQNRRILDRIAGAAGLAINPAIVSNSYLGVFAQVRRGRFGAIVPHTFLDLLGPAQGIFARSLVEPTHSEVIGLVLSDRDPLSPMANALLASIFKADFEDADRDVAA